ncbi:MAG: DUF4270 domain-containing protein [Bacteroides sp.]|nr:DUF4270 domain-containing protein [Bacteroides sp.]
MKKLLFIAAVIAAMCSATSCDDDVSPIGSSLVKDQIEIIIDTTYNLTGHSVESPYVQAHTVLQLIGSMTAEGYGTFSSSVVTQFMPTETFVTEGVTAESIDSVKLIMRVPLGAYVGDSMAIMGLTAYPLTRQLPSAITSAFDPQGYFDASAPMGSTMYALNGGAVPDSMASFPYRFITIDLGKEFGRKVFNKYKDSPSTFATPEAFAQWFPGMYLANTFGSGRVAQVDSTVISMYYRQTLPIDDEKNPRDTVYNRVSSYLAVTPEILTNNNMAFTIAPSLKERAKAGEPILVAPTGYDVQMNFPARDIIKRYRSSGTDLTVVNSLQLTVPVEEIPNNFGITPPPYVLLVKKSMKDEFFAKSMLPDNINSFYADYDSYTRSYTFTDMRDYILDLLAKDEVTDEDEEFVVCAVTMSFEKRASSSASIYYLYYYGMSNTETEVVAGVTPYVHRPAMAKLALDKSKITFTYSVQNLNF